MASFLRAEESQERRAVASHADRDVGQDDAYPGGSYSSSRRSEPAWFGGHPNLKRRWGVQVAKKRRKRRQFTPEYKAEVVKFVQTSGKTVGQVARELELTKNAVRAWVKAAEVDDGNAQVEHDANLQAAKRRIKELENGEGSSKHRDWSATRPTTAWSTCSCRPSAATTSRLRRRH